VGWCTRAPARDDVGWVSGQRVSWEQSAIVWRDEVTAGDPGRDHRNEPGVERSDTPGRPPPNHDRHPVRGA
jgi:hypothetical protein